MKKIIISADVLKKALAKLSHAINSKGILPITTSLLCKVESKTLTLIATNTEVTILYKVECEAKEDFEFLLPFDFIQKVVGFNPHCPIEIEAGVKKVKVKTYDDVYEAKLSAKVDEFPTIPQIENKQFIAINDDVLKSLHTAISTAAPLNSNSLSQLTNILLELSIGKITVASTDSAYMVYSQEFESENKEEAQLLLAVKSIIALNSLIDVKLCYNENFTCFISDDVTVINTRTQDKFANFRKVFPADWAANFTINKALLYDAILKTSMATDDLKSATITLCADKVNIQSYDSQFKVNLDVLATYTGTVTEVSIKYDKLQKLLAQIDTTDINLAIYDASKAIIITSEELPGYKAMIMPIAQSK
jgi:DNA polymerase III sliding clamp (beta) subunit (PCNA family)